MKSFTSWMSGSWLSCRKYAERTSVSVEKPLHGWDRIGFLFHHYWCFTCRRFRKQLLQVEDGLQHFAEVAKERPEELLQEHSLSPEACSKIRRACEREPKR